MTPENKYYSLSSSVALPLYPTTLTWDALRSILTSSAAKGVRPGLVWLPRHMGFDIYIWLSGFRKNLSSSQNTLFTSVLCPFEISILPESPQEHFLLSNQSDFSFHLRCNLCLRWQEVNGPGWLILLNVKVVRSMEHQIRVLRCEGEGSEESLGELLVSLLCWI